MNAQKHVNRVWQFVLTLILLTGLLLPVTGVVHATDTRVVNPTLPEEFDWPSWWNGEDDCDATWYNANKTGGDNASLQTEWRGVQSCEPQPGSVDGYATPDFPDSAYDKKMFQCTELAARYLEQAYGINSYAGNGINFASSYADEYPESFIYYENDGSAEIYPQEGDVVSMDSDDPYGNGHVAIVTALYADSANLGDGYIELMDQNGSANGYFSMDIEDYVIQDYGSFEPQDWIHPVVGMENSPTASLTSHVLGIDSDGHTNVWMAGDDNPVGYNKRAATWYWDGSDWSAYYPTTIAGVYKHHYLHDIEIDSNEDVWTVGEYNTSGSYWQTMVYQWDSINTEWDRITSDNYSANSGNYLNAVASDGSGDVWAVGYYYASGYYPLLLKWDGSDSFDDEGLSWPSGTTGSKLTDISFSSSSNGWIVGTIGTLANGYYAYQWDGSDWDAVELPEDAYISKVVAVSSSEAWGVGAYRAGAYWISHIFHYTTANGWEDVWGETTYSSGLPTFYDIDADDEGVWVVGLKLNGSYNQPYMMRYTGISWQEVSSQAYTYGGYLKGISLSDGYAWSAGDYKVTSSPSSPYYPIVLVK